MKKRRRKKASKNQLPLPTPPKSEPETERTPDTLRSQRNPEIEAFQERPSPWEDIGYGRS